MIDVVGVQRESCQPKTALITLRSSLIHVQMWTTHNTPLQKVRGKEDIRKREFDITSCGTRLLVGMKTHNARCEHRAT